ncbi:MAG: ECF-type sigma factor [Aquimonas sp.]|nr:ECF-type sigma factor [Aquimonas sp.]
MHSDPPQTEPARSAAAESADSTDAVWTTSLMPLLERIAEKHLRGEREAITLEAGDLVQEAYLRLSELELPIRSRQHFLSLASTAMRRVLVDHARRKQAGKRGARPIKVTLRACDDGLAGSGAVQLLDLDELLNDLARLDARKAQLIELHYFGGLSRAEMAEVTGLSPATLGRELSFARSWILAQLETSG